MPILLIVLTLAALAGGAYLLLGGDPDVPVVAEDETPPGPVQLEGVGAIDPAGDGEHDAEAPAATDGDSGTFWTTQTYQSFTKEGVGLLLEASRSTALSRLVVESDEAGFPAKIRAGSSRGGPFTDVSSEQTVGRVTTFSVDTKGKDYRYYLVWLRLPDGGRAHINEVRSG